MSDKKEQQPRTIQVKIGQQQAREMTPDQAAEYLKCMAAASSSANPLRSDRLAFSFGGRKTAGGGGDSSKAQAAAAAAAAGFWKMSADAKETSSMNAAVTRASSAVRNSSTSMAGTATVGGTGTGNGTNSSIPCTEKEMKALMSMVRTPGMDSSATWT